MNQTESPAAGEGGNDTAPPPPTPDERHRQCALQELSGYLARSAAMLARCESLSNAPQGDRLGPIYAAARLMNANARVATALAHVALVERRSRTIVETIQPPRPENRELNSGFRNYDDARAELMRRIDATVEEGAREQERLDGLNIGCCI